jgi:hypothetical protein
VIEALSFSLAARVFAFGINILAGKLTRNGGEREEGIS